MLSRREGTRTIRKMIDRRRKRGVLLQRVEKARATGGGKRLACLALPLVHLVSLFLFCVILVPQ